MFTHRYMNNIDTLQWEIGATENIHEFHASLIIREYFVAKLFI